MKEQVNQKPNEKPLGAEANADDLFIVELDERLEFGVIAVESTFSPDVNTSCLNRYSCTDTNAQNCTNGSSC